MHRFLLSLSLSFSRSTYFSGLPFGIFETVLQKSSTDTRLEEVKCFFAILGLFEFMKKIVQVRACFWLQSAKNLQLYYLYFMKF